MAEQQETPVAGFRKRLKQRGLVRVEVQVRRGDAALMRGIAAALNDPTREAETREALRKRLGSTSTDLKALLEAAPFDDLELERDRDVGRPVAL